MALLQVNKLSRDYINSLPIIRFEGKVVVVSRPVHEEKVILQLRSETYVGFDTESRPSFKKGIFFPISLVQLATDDTAYLFQLKKTGFSDALAGFLSDKNIKKIGIGIKSDFEKLQELKEFNPAGLIDLSKIAAEKGIIQVGVRGLTARYIEQRLVKRAQTTNWANLQLTQKQQIYAASDAWICLQIYPLLIADKTDYNQFIEGESKETIDNE